MSQTEAARTEVFERWDSQLLRVPREDARKARYRLLQSRYRELRLGKARYGFHLGRDKGRRVGSALHWEDVATDPSLNFLSDAAADYAQSRSTKVNKTGGTAEQYRLMHNMLSSQPMCFSIFGQLRELPDRGLALVRQLFDPRAERVEWIDCEWKPASNPLGDRTAMDAAILTCRADGSRHLIGVETKYTEPFSSGQPTSATYREIHRSSGWFHEATEESLVPRATNQLWRNTLLAAACELSDEIEGDTAETVVVCLADDPAAAAAVKGIREVLADPERCRQVSLEALRDVAPQVLGQRWASAFDERYLRTEFVDPGETASLGR